MTVKQALVVAANIETKILLIRGQKVMLDADLAELYGVETKRLNEQMRRNIERFPVDFMFRLSAEEKAEVVANCDHLAKLKYSATLPYAFTEHGALMLGNVLKSDRAVEVSLMVVRAFVQLRQMLASNAELSRKLVALEKNYDVKFKAIFEAIRRPQEKTSHRFRAVGEKMMLTLTFQSIRADGGGMALDCIAHQKVLQSATMNRRMP